MTQEIVTAEYREIQLGALSANGPRAVVERAVEVATELAKIVREKKLSRSISGREYVYVEGWTTLGAMLGVVPREVTALEQENGDFAAVVELVRVSDGAVIGRGSAILGYDEQTWANRPRYARRSMSITRATGKAFRLSFSWVMKLAGYEATPLEEMADTEASQTAAWAWLGGFIDGEGNLGIYEEKDPRKGENYSHPRAMLQITNTQPDAITRIKEIIGEGDTRKVEDGRSENHKPLYRFNLRRHEALHEVLKTVLPHLVIKRRQATLIIEFLASRIAAEGRGRYAEFTERERQIIAELKPMNKTGPTEPTPAEEMEPEVERTVKPQSGNGQPQPTDEQRMAMMRAVTGDANPPDLKGQADEPETFKHATIHVRKEDANWRKALAAFVTRWPKYQTVVKGKPSGQPNMYHILGAAAKVGFPDITDDNWGTVLELIDKRATELEPQTA